MAESSRASCDDYGGLFRACACQSNAGLAGASACIERQSPVQPTKHGQGRGSQPNHP
jgi:hypothetical protein